jgi:TPP-dependent pyruvate/acetoin dehydrogenase alpha subunit
VDLPALRQTNAKVVKDLAETKQRNIFHEQLKLAAQHTNSTGNTVHQNFALSKEDARLVVTSSITTFMLHVEARIASTCGQGFYTIGPCGEELLSAIGLSLNPTDPSALHYRHVGAAVLKQLRAGRSVADIVLDRARGYTVSSLDPVAGGRHCAIGGSEYDFYVTSTLASQCCPAVGRAQGIALAQAIKAPGPFPKDAVSFVSLGDGSANNGHFLSALNLAEYSAFNKIKVRTPSFACVETLRIHLTALRFVCVQCPVVFAISDNGVSISLKDKGWINELCSRVGMKKFVADGANASDVHTQTKAAVAHARQSRRPTLLASPVCHRRIGFAMSSITCRRDVL